MSRPLELALEQMLAAQWDPRRQFWTWSEDSPRRLLARPGPAAEAAQRLIAAEGGGVELELLANEEPWQVTSSWTSLRQGPSHAAEQVSQLLLGQCFTLWTRDPSGLWSLGAGPDGYPGWIRSWHLRPGSPPQPDNVVCRRSARALASPEAGAPLLQELSFASGLRAAGAARNGCLPWRHPDGRELWTPLSELAAFPCAPQIARERLRSWGRRLLGIPYEWGGCTSRGFDCSGLMQTLFAALGVTLPRDADLQAERGRARASGDPADCCAGDLLFFGAPRVDHVALHLGNGHVLHASGEVKIEKLHAKRRLRERECVAVVDGESLIESI